MRKSIDEKQKAREDFEKGVYTQGFSDVYNNEYARLYDKQENLTAISEKLFQCACENYGHTKHI